MYKKILNKNCDHKILKVLQKFESPNNKNERYFVDIYHLYDELKKESNLSNNYLISKKIIIPEEEVIYKSNSLDLDLFYLVEKNFFDEKKEQYILENNVEDFVFSLTYNKEKFSKDLFLTEDEKILNRFFDTIALIEASYDIKYDIITSLYKDKYNFIPEEKYKTKNNENPFNIKDINLIDNIFQNHGLENEIDLKSKIKLEIQKNNLTFLMLASTFDDEFYKKNKSRKSVGFNNFNEIINKNEQLERKIEIIITDYMKSIYEKKINEIILNHNINEDDKEQINNILNIKLEDKLINKSDEDFFNDFKLPYIYSNKKDSLSDFLVEIYDEIKEHPFLKNQINKDFNDDNLKIMSHNYENYIKKLIEEEIFELDSFISKDINKSVDMFLEKLNSMNEEIYQIEKTETFKKIKEKESLNNEELELYENYKSLNEKKINFIPYSIEKKILDIQKESLNDKTNIKDNKILLSEQFILSNPSVIQISNSTIHSLTDVFNYQYQTDEFFDKISKNKEVEEYETSLIKKGNGLLYVPYMQHDFEFENNDKTKNRLVLTKIISENNLISYKVIFSLKNNELINSLSSEEPFNKIINLNEPIQTVKGTKQIYEKNDKKNVLNTLEDKYIKFNLIPSDKDLQLAEANKKLAYLENDIDKRNDYMNRAKTLEKGTIVLIQEDKMWEYFNQFSYGKQIVKSEQNTKKEESLFINEDNKFIIRELKSNKNYVMDEIYKYLDKEGFPLNSTDFSFDSDYENFNLTFDGSVFYQKEMSFNKYSDDLDSYINDITRLIEEEIKHQLNDEIMHNLDLIKDGDIENDAIVDKKINQYYKFIYNQIPIEENTLYNTINIVKTGMFIDEFNEFLENKNMQNEKTNEIDNEEEIKDFYDSYEL